MYHDISIVHKTYKFYVRLYSCIKTFPKKDRFTLGQKCENTALEILELLFLANSKPNSKKIPVLADVDLKLKVLQTLIRICNDVRAIEQKTYISLEEPLEEIGRMLGGWIKSLK